MSERETAKKGDAKLAISLLDRVVASYPNTNAAREAKEALARPAKNLPLFIDRPVVVANPAAPKPAEPKPAPKVVDATAPTAPQGNSAEVAIVYPANPAEPTRGAPAVAPQEVAPPVGRPLPKGFHSRPGTQAHESGWALEIVGDRDGAPMVLVPGGEFTMGTDEGDAAERPAHRVFLSTYYIDQHEVSVRQFDLFEKEVGRRTDRVRALAREATIAPTSVDSPVVMVSAKEAKDFASWAGKRLPTEAQWEMAARGPDGRIYPWGNDPPEWAKTRKARQIEPIMTYADDISPFGAYDMAGNAWEWTKDWYDSRYFVLVKNQKLSDPTGPTIVPRTYQLAVKGGSKTWTVAKREGLKFDQRFPFLGFRCVLAVEGPGNAFEPPPKPTPPGGNAPGLINTGDGTSAVLIVCRPEGAAVPIGDTEKSFAHFAAPFRGCKIAYDDAWLVLRASHRADSACDVHNPLRSSRSPVADAAVSVEGPQEDFLLERVFLDGFLVDLDAQSRDECWGGRCVPWARR